MAIQNIAPSQSRFSALAANNDQTSGMRMMVPVIKTIEDLKGAKKVVDTFTETARSARAARAAQAALEGGVTSGGSAVNSIGSTISGGLKSLPHLLKSNFLFAAIGSAVTGAIDLFKGEKPAKVAANFMADTVAYTGIGATATMVGGMVGSIVPGIGTIVGIAVGALVGLGLGKLYEGNVRSKFSNLFAENVVAKLIPEQTAPALPAAQ
ncbi:MAG TPA: hypothetical protein DD435_03305 [Cyanobacteria bacterium UBA8530]|nr:hypothetical protein [Cyanobacteria bacterium UBA8530]